MLMIFGRGRKVEDTRIHNSDLMSNVDSKESTLGCVFISNGIWYIGRVLNNWSLQILEVKYVIAYEVAKEAFWSIIELGVVSRDDTTVKKYILKSIIWMIALFIIYI